MHKKNHQSSITVSLLPSPREERYERSERREAEWHRPVAPRIAGDGFLAFESETGFQPPNTEERGLSPGGAWRRVRSFKKVRARPRLGRVGITRRVRVICATRNILLGTAFTL